MNKQRLLELAGITEARHASESDSHWAVVTYDDGEFYVVAPFKNKAEAEKYVQWEVKEFDLDEEQVGQITMIEPPAW